MSSVNNTQTPSPKSVSSENREASNEKTPVNSSQASIADATSPTNTMEKTKNIELLSPASSKRSSLASPSHSSGDEGSGVESLASSKRRKIQHGKKTSGSSSRLPSPRGLISYKGVGLTSGRTGLAVTKDTEIEKHIYLDPADTTSFPAVAQEASITGDTTSPSAPATTTASVESTKETQAAEPLSPDTSSSPIVSTAATPTSTVNGEDDGVSALILSRSSSPIDEPVTPTYFSLATNGGLSSIFTVPRLADLNEMIRNIVNTKPENNIAMVLSKDMADVLLYKDLLIKEANQHISKVEKDSQVTLEQLFFSNDAKSDLIDKARAETGRVKAELAVYTELEEKKRRYHNTWSPEDVSWSDRKQSLEQIRGLKENLAEARDEVKTWRAVFKDNSETIGALRIRQKELLKDPSALMAESNEAKKQLGASKDEIIRLMELQEADKAEHRSLVEQLRAQHGEFKRQLDAAIVKAGSYQQLQSANNAHEMELASLKEENRRMKLRIQQHVDAQTVNVTRFDTLKEMLKVKGNQCEALQLDFDRLKCEHDRCGDTHQRLQIQLEQGRQWANAVVNNCPFGLDRVVAAESARDTANSLRVIAELEFQILQDDNTYQRSRSMFPNPVDDAIPSIETRPAQVDTQSEAPSHSRRGSTASVSADTQAYQEFRNKVERKRVLNAAAAKKPFDGNQAFYGMPGNTQMDDAYGASPLLRHAETPVSATANTTVPFPPFDNDISMRLMADMRYQEQDDNRPDESHRTFKVEDQEDIDELPDYEDYESLDNAQVHPASPRVKSEEVDQPFAAEESPDYLPAYESDAPRGRYALGQVDGYLDPNPDVLSDDDDDDESLLSGEGCSHRRVFADGTCASCGNKLPRPQVEAPRPVRAGFRQARQASPTVSVPAIQKKQSASSVKECYSSMFGGQCGGIGCTCNPTRKPLPEVPTTGATTEVPCSHNIQFMGMCGMCGKDISTIAPRAIPRAPSPSPSPSRASSPSPPSKKRGRFADDSDSDSDSESFGTGFRATKKAKTVATPIEHGHSPVVAPSEHGHSEAQTPGPSDGDSDN